ncbi:MAG: hypothetical protein DRJ65_15810 [Acidobacteria bacterium]|nr:MAG: hypothetical protein DRJ65_15810 [Acidobacteriota bacterium]
MALAETRLLRFSPWVAPLDVVRTVAQIGRVLQDNIKDGTPRRRFWVLSVLGATIGLVPNPSIT